MKLDVKKIIEELDLLFSKNEAEKAGKFLYEKLALSREYSDKASELAILNELIGFHRRTNKKDEALSAVNDALSLVESGEFGDGITAATTYLNSATTLFSYGFSERAMNLYEKAEKVYSVRLQKNDYRLAAFYNNYGLALNETGECEKAKECYEKALDILFFTGENKAEIAVTYCNMAYVYEKYEDYEHADECLDNAMKNLDSETERNGYYAFNCEKCADAFDYFGRFFDCGKLKERAKDIYERN